MNTRTKTEDYTNCNSDIAKALISGLEVECLVTDEHNVKCGPVWICRYNHSDKRPYMTCEGYRFKKAEPTPDKIRYLKDRRSLVLILIEDGFIPDNEGDWSDAKGNIFQSCHFRFCEQPLPKGFDLKLSWTELR